MRNKTELDKFIASHTKLHVKGHDFTPTALQTWTLELAEAIRADMQELEYSIFPERKPRPVSPDVYLTAETPEHKKFYGGQP